MVEDKARSEATFRYIVENVSQMKDCQLSPAFYVRNLPWQIGVTPHARPTQNYPKDFLSFYLICHLNEECKSISWGCYAVAELRLLSHKQGQEPFSRKIRGLFCSKDKIFGYNGFMTWQSVLDPDRGFIKNDSITLEVHVNVLHGVSCNGNKHSGHIELKNQDATNYMNSLHQTVFYLNQLQKTLYKMSMESNESNKARSEAIFRYTVENVSKMEDFLFSSAFYVRNLPWQIGVLPHSRPTQNNPKGFLSFFLVCNKESRSTVWSCYAVAELRLLSCKGQKLFSRKIEGLFCSENNNWGCDFMKWQNVLNPDRSFINDDSITLEVHVMADAPLGVSCDSKEHPDYVGLKNQSGTDYPVWLSEYVNYLLQTQFFSNQLQKAVYKMSPERVDSNEMSMEIDDSNKMSMEVDDSNKMSMKSNNSHEMQTKKEDSKTPNDGMKNGTASHPMNCEPRELACIVQDQEMQEDKARSEATFRYTVKNVSKIKDSELSPACYVRNLPWKIMVRLSQTMERHPEKSLSFFLQCNGESKSTLWSCYAVAELRLLSCKGQESCNRKIQHLFYSNKNDWGFIHFITWQDVLDPNKGFIKDDSITLEVHVMADVAHGLSCDSKNRTDCVGLKNQSVMS